jgi:hypothetical protein
MSHLYTIMIYNYDILPYTIMIYNYDILLYTIMIYYYIQLRRLHKLILLGVDYLTPNKTFMFYVSA